ncbi:hypothetical protein FRC18_011780 [Serendipita sp. 400]|nr:hypothetical protein FRC18_011780 [Serendipita sp. 400]
MRLQQVLLQISPITPAIIIYVIGGGLYTSIAICISLFFLRFVFLDEGKQSASQLHVLVDPRDPLVDVVAVQGLGSTYPYTWMGKNNLTRRKTWFPFSKPKVERVEWLRRYLPEDLPAARIMAFEYNSKWLYNSDFLGLHEHASALLTALVDNRQDSPGRPILFIGHSYGGLVIKQTLILSHKGKTDPPNLRQWIADVESSIAFLGTPHQGSNYALFAHILSFFYAPFGGTYAHVLKLLSDSDRLVELDRDFKDVLSGGQTKQTVCFYETKGQLWSWLLGPMVTRTSAYLGQGDEAAMECNHDEMNKFFDRDERYKTFIETLQRLYYPLANPVANEASKDRLRKILAGRIVNGSTYSSTEVRGCTAGTRQTILNRLMDWARDSDSKRARVCWLTGMVGTGKTTIASTLCQRLERDGILGASFFCSNTEDQTHNMRHLLPTLAYALGESSQKMADALLGALRDKNVADMNLKDTFTNLISSPASIDMSPFHGKTRVIVLDGFDQVKDQDRVKTILSFILEHAGAVALKFFISSRPLSEKFKKTPQLWRLDLYERPEAEVREDIKLYVQQRLGEIAERLGDEGIGWPAQEQVDTIVDRANPLFIYAATVCSYVDEEDDNQAKRRLKAVIDKAPVKGSESPTDKLYALYKQITNAASKRPNDDIDEILGLIVVARDHLSIQSIASLLFADDEADGASRVSAVLSALRSVLSVPKDRTVGVRVIHTSFPDFLTDPARSDETHHQDPFECHRKLATCCLSLMEKLLDKDDIGGLQEPDTSWGDVRKGANISNALEYSCVHWISHVVEAYSLKPEPAKELEADISRFFDVRVLRWLVHMSVLGKLSHAAASLRKLELHSQASARVRKASMEARRLMSQSYSLLEKYPLQIYYSALMQIPKKSDIAKRFRRDWNWEVTSGLAEDWERCEGVLRLGSMVKSVVFSNDGRMVAACAWEEIRIWSVEDLKKLCVVRPPDDPACIVLSSDGKIVAAGFKKGGIQIWDIETKNERVRDIGKESISCIAFIDKDQEVIYGSSKSICRYSVKSNEQLTDIKLKLEGRPLSFSRDGKRALLNGQVHVYIINTETGDKISTLDIPGFEVEASAFSRDGEKVVFGLYDGKIRIFDVQSGNGGAQLIGHVDAVTSVAFSGDDQRIVSGSLDASVRIWSVSDGKEEIKLVGHTSWVVSVAYSDDGLRIASGSNDGTVRIWSVEPGLEERQASSEDRWKVTALALSSDGQRVFYARDRSRRIHIRNVDNGKEERPLIVGRDHVNTVAISNDGRHAVIARGKRLHIYNIDDGDPLADMEGHEDLILSVAFSPDNQRMATGSRDKTIRIWDLKIGKEKKKKQLEGHEDSVWSVSFSADGSKLVSGSSDQTVRIWDLESESAMIKTLRGHTGPVLCVAFSSDSQMVVSGSHDKTVRVWDVEIGEVKQQQTYGDSIWSVAFSPSNSKIVSGCNCHRIYIWDLEGEEMAVLEGHTDAIISVAFSFDQQKVVSGSHDKTVRIWDLGTGKEVRGMVGHTDSVQFVQFQDDDTVLSASHDGSYRAWDVQTGKQETMVNGFGNRVESIALSSDDRLLAVGLKDHTIRILDMETGDERSLQGHTDTVAAVAFSDNNEKIVSVSHDNTVRIWNVEKKEEKKRLDFGPHELYSAAFSPDPKIVALGGWDGTIWFWNVETGVMEKKFKSGQKEVSSMSFIDATHLLLQFYDAVEMWNMETGEKDEDVADTANVPILLRDEWIHSPSNARCWFPLNDVFRVTSNASCIVFRLYSGGIVVVKFKQPILRK